MKTKVSITFFSGAGTVTGANFLLQIDDEGRVYRFLIDCGLLQGGNVCDECNFKPFAYDPKSVDALFVTHGHLDHVGRIGKLVQDGFNGNIYSTPPTKDIAELIMLDSLGVMEKENIEAGRDPLYTEADVARASSMWEVFGYHEPIKIGNIQIVFRDAGHVLGSSMVEFTVNGKKIMFTGDLGNTPAPLLKDTEVISDIDYLIMESVYGDRNHELREERETLLKKVIKDTMTAGGNLMIPAFSVERTQELLFEIENMMEKSDIPLVPVFLDSPLAIEITKIYKKYASYFNSDVSKIVQAGDGLIFNFPQLQFTKSTEQSKAIARVNNRKIIIAGSGMSNGGRILHHERAYLPDQNSTLLLAGYQAVGSLGRLLQDGAKSVKIMGQIVKVRARIVSISGFSAHKDSDDLVEFVAGSAETLKQVYCVMGEPKSSLFLVQRLRDYLGVEASAPQAGEVVNLEL